MQRCMLDSGPRCKAMGAVQHHLIPSVQTVVVCLSVRMASSLIQPMDQGIIANFKQHYRSLVLRHLMAVMEIANENQRAAEVARKLTLVDSLHLQKAARVALPKQQSLIATSGPALQLKATSRRAPVATSRSRRSHLSRPALPRRSTLICRPA